MMMGGQINSDIQIDSHFAIYDLRSNQHRQMMPMHMKLIWFGMTMVHEDVLVCGGINEDKWPPPVNATAVFVNGAPRYY
jgi:hypothetical protein